MVHHILKNEVDLILPKFYEVQKSKRRIFSALISGFIGLAFEGISSFLHHKRHNALHKAVKAMSILTDVQRHKLMHLENTLFIYEIYNAETLERLVKMEYNLPYESLFAGQTSAAYEAYSQMHGACGIQHYTVNLMLYLHTIKDKYIEIYSGFIF